MSMKRMLPALLVVALLVVGGVAAYALYQVGQLQAAIASINQQIAPKPSYAMWTVGTGGDGVNPYREWIAIYPESTLYPIPGAPSLRFVDHARDDPDKPRDFEIGFYKYGPTWYSRNSITEFWLGNGDGGILSIAGNDNGGGEFQARNPTDTDSISLSYRDAEQPRISVGNNNPLYLRADEGLISESAHTFEQGIHMPSDSGYAGQVTDGDWAGGEITIATDAVAQDSVIIVTPLSQPHGQWWVSRQEAGQTFTVSSSADDEDMDFNWLIIGG